MSNDAKTVQREALLKSFQRVTEVRSTIRETTLEVEHTLPNRGYSLSVYVTFDSSFPRTPPIISTFNGRQVSFAPPGSPSTGKQSPWDPSKSTLTEAVGNALENLATLWGSVVPPTLEQVTAQLSNQSDEVLEDIVSNPNCLETFAHQMPFMKSIREASQQTVDDVERVALANMSLQPEMEALQTEIAEAQKRLASQLTEVEKARSVIPLVNSIGTPDALAKTIARDVRVLDGECEALEKQLMGINYATDKRAFSNILEEFKKKSKQRHTLDLKRRAYNASIRTK